MSPCLLRYVVVLRNFGSAFRDRTRRAISMYWMSCGTVARVPSCLRYTKFRASTLPATASHPPLVLVTLKRSRVCAPALNLYAICSALSFLIVSSDCSFETITERMRESEAAVRPLTRDPNAFRRLYDERREAYSRATYRVDANCDVEQAIEQIMALPAWK